MSNKPATSMERQVQIPYTNTRGSCKYVYAVCNKDCSKVEYCHVDEDEDGLDH